MTPAALSDLADRAAKNAAKAARAAAADSLAEFRKWVSEAVATAPRLLHAATRDKVLPPGEALVDGVLTAESVLLLDQKEKAWESFWRDPGRSEAALFDALDLARAEARRKPLPP